MTDFDLEESDEGVWFPFFESHVDELTGKITYDLPVQDSGKVKIRSIKPFIRDLLKKDEKNNKVEFVVNPKTRGLERIKYREEKSIEAQLKETEDMHSYAIMEWEGFINKRTKEPIELTDENKIKLSRNPQFSRFFDRCQKLLEEGESLTLEEEEKN